MGDAKAKKAEVSQRDLDKGLWVAASEGNLKEVQALKGKGANPTWFNPWEPPGRGLQFNALHVASGGGHIEIVKYLVETCKVDFRAKCQYGETALEYAEGRDRGSKGKEAVVAFLKEVDKAHLEKLRLQHEEEEKKRLDDLKKSKEAVKGGAKATKGAAKKSEPKDAYPVSAK